jgi:hypothetical protein
MTSAPTIKATGPRIRRGRRQTPSQSLNMLHRAERGRLDGRHHYLRRWRGFDRSALSRIEIPAGRPLSAANCSIFGRKHRGPELHTISRADIDLAEVAYGTSIVFNLMITALDEEAEAETQDRFVAKRLGLPEHSFLNKVSVSRRRNRQQCERSPLKTRNVSRKLSLVNARDLSICKMGIRDGHSPAVAALPRAFPPDLDRRRKPRGPFFWKIDCWKKRKELSEIEQY